MLAGPDRAGQISSSGSKPLFPRHQLPVSAGATFGISVLCPFKHDHAAYRPKVSIESQKQRYPSPILNTPSLF